MSNDCALSISEILIGALTRLRTKDRHVSQRSLAVQIEISHSYLSKIFRGERVVPLKLLPKLTKHLQLDHHETLEIQRQVLILQNFSEKDLSETHTENRLVSNYQALGKVDLWLLQEWYHIPLLNLVTVDDFVDSAKWMAKRLGISIKQVNESIKRSEKYGYLQKNQSDVLERSELNLRIPTQRSHSQIRDFHADMIQKAHSEIKKIPNEKEFSKRLISGVSFAGDPSKVRDAKIILEQAAAKAAELMTGGQCTEVFQLNLQLFSVTPTDV